MLADFILEEEIYKYSIGGLFSYDCHSNITSGLIISDSSISAWTDIIRIKFCETLHPMTIAVIMVEALMLWLTSPNPSRRKQDRFVLDRIYATIYWLHKIRASECTATYAVAENDYFQPHRSEWRETVNESCLCESQR